MNCLLSIFSHRFQIYTELLAEYILPQISQIYTDCLGAFKGVHLSQVHQPSKKCTNQAKSIFSHGIHRTHRTAC